MEHAMIVWTDYMKYRLNLRGYDLATVEKIVRYSSERYVDTVTGRLVAIGRHESLLVMIPYELKRRKADADHNSCDESATNQIMNKIGEI